MLTPEGGLYAVDVFAPENIVPPILDSGIQQPKGEEETAAEEESLCQGMNGPGDHVLHVSADNGRVK